MVRLDGTFESGRFKGGPLVDRYFVLIIDVGVVISNAVVFGVYVG